MNRRGFFGVLVGAVLAPFLPKPAPLRFHPKAFDLTMAPLRIPAGKMRMPPMPNFHETYLRYRSFATAHPFTVRDFEWYEVK